MQALGEALRDAESRAAAETLEPLGPGDAAPVELAELPANRLAAVDDVLPELPRNVEPRRLALWAMAGAVVVVLAVGVTVALRRAGRASHPVTAAAASAGDPMRGPAPGGVTDGVATTDLVLDSIPSGAKVFAGGRLICETPDAIKVPIGTTLEVLLHRDGFISKQVTIDPARDGRKVMVRLERDPLRPRNPNPGPSLSPSPSPPRPLPPPAPATREPAPASREPAPGEAGARAGETGTCRRRPRSTRRPPSTSTPRSRRLRRSARPATHPRGRRHWTPTRISGTTGECVALWSALVTIAAFLLLVLPPRLALAGDNPDEMAAAKQHFEAGRTAYLAADYTRAISEFGAAQTIRPSPILDYNIGLCYEALGDAGNAYSYFQRYLTGKPDAENRADVEKRMEALSRHLQQPPAPSGGSAQAQVQQGAGADPYGQPSYPAPAPGPGEEEELLVGGVPHRRRTRAHRPHHLGRGLERLVRSPRLRRHLPAAAALAGAGCAARSRRHAGAARRSPPVLASAPAEPARVPRSLAIASGSR